MRDVAEIERDIEAGDDEILAEIRALSGRLQRLESSLQRTRKT